MSHSSNLLQDFFLRYPLALRFIEGFSPWEVSMKIPPACELLRSQWLTGGRDDHLRERAARCFLQAWEDFRQLPIRPLGFECWVRLPVRMKIKERSCGFDSRLGHRDLLESMMRESEASEMLRVLVVQSSASSGFVLEVGGLHKSLEGVSSTRYGNAVGFAGEEVADALPIRDRHRKECLDAHAEALNEHWFFAWLCRGV